MLHWRMTRKRKLSDDDAARVCGKAVEKIITRLVTGDQLTITISEADAKRWGFPDIPSMRMTMEEFAKALPPSISHLLTVREGSRT